jgi:hypothetical protein
MNVLSDLAFLLIQGGNVRAEYVPETKHFVVHWIGPDATRCAVMAANFENALTLLVQKIESADTEPPPAIRTAP